MQKKRETCLKIVVSKVKTNNSLRVDLMIACILTMLNVNGQQYQSLSSNTLPSWQAIALTGQQGMIGAISYQNNMPAFGKAFISQNIGFENNITKYNSAWGGQMYHESLGNGISTLSQIFFTYCYSIKLNNKQLFNFGLQTGLSYYQLNSSNALTNDEEFLPNQKKTNFNIEIGNAWIASNYGIALSIKNPEALFSTKKEYVAQPALLLYTYIESKQRNEKKTKYTQSLFCNFQKQGFVTYKSMVRYQFIEINSSLSYPFYTKSPWVGVGIGVTENKYTFRYTYNHTVGQALKLPFNNHQIALLITFKKKQRGRPY